MKAIRFCATDNGESHFVEIDVPLENAQQDADGNTLLRSNSYVSPNVTFVELPGGMSQSWHNAPARQIVVVLSGEVEVSTSDGQMRRWRAGEFFLADDLTGKGHLTKSVGGAVRLLFAPLPDGFDIARWSIR